MSNSDALTSGTDRSGLTVVGSKTIMASNDTRNGGAFQNISDTAMFVNQTGATATALNGFFVAAGTGINLVTDQAVSVYCTVAGKAYVALEF